MVPLAHPHLVRAWGIALDTGDGDRGLLLDVAAAGSLAGLLTHGGVLSPSRMVTALSPIAEACAHLHTQGASHGDVTAANILLTPEGKPVLADLGDAYLLGMGNDAVSGEQDVRALARVAWLCLAGEAPGRGRRRTPLRVICPQVSEGLADLLEECLEAGDGDMPGAWEFAAEVYASADPEPLNLRAQTDEEVLAELPTMLPSGPPGKRRGRRRESLAGGLSRLLRAGRRGSPRARGRALLRSEPLRASP